MRSNPSAPEASSQLLADERTAEAEGFTAIDLPSITRWTSSNLGLRCGGEKRRHSQILDDLDCGTPGSYKPSVNENTSRRKKRRDTQERASWIRMIEPFPILPTSTSPTQAGRIAFGKETVSTRETDSGRDVMTFLSTTTVSMSF